jgi:geranylgeranyl diphosphate synthase, type II
LSVTELNLKEYMQEHRRKVEENLERLLPLQSEAPRRLTEAMRHSVFAGGKRFRPILVLSSAEAASGTNDISQSRKLLEAASAVELLHTYSLVHDDLPSMDDDDLRRGKPTCHKAFDEATAILAGDALQAMAFQVLAELPETPGEQRAACVAILAQATGAAGMVGGQVEDLLAEGKEGLSTRLVESIHEKKTAALIEACCRIGGVLAGCREEKLERLGGYGRALGLAFQIIDDILDVVGEQSELGKTIGKDESVAKATYPAALGLEEARKKAEALIVAAVDQLKPFGPDAEALRQLAWFVCDRKS